MNMCPFDWHITIKNGTSDDNFGWVYHVTTFIIVHLVRLCCVIHLLFVHGHVTVVDRLKADRIFKAL